MRIQPYIRICALILADILCVVGVWYVVVMGYLSFGGHYDPKAYLSLWPLPIAFVFLNACLKLYHGSALIPSAPISPVEEMRRLVFSSMMTHFGLTTVIVLLMRSGQSFGDTENYSRLVIVVSGVIIAFFTQLFRDFFRWLLFKLHIGQIPVMLAGSGDVAHRAIAILNDNAYTGFKVVGYFGDDVGPIDKVTHLGGFRDIVNVSRAMGIRILLACQEERLFRCQLRELSAWFSHIEYLPVLEVFPIYGSRAVIFDGLGGIEMVNQSCMGVLRLEKWIMDKIFSIIAFALLSPLFIIVPILIKLTSRGSVFFRQRRLGRNGKEIWVWKFRSMYHDADVRLRELLANDPAAAAEWRKNYKLSNDPRVTPLGKILRKTSIDELPQIFNVFMGQMALVGPRPIVKEEIQYYGDVYPVISAAKPGITGLWQTSGRSDTDYARRVALDTYYVLNWSPWLDIWILIRTVFAVLRMRGAY